MGIITVLWEKWVEFRRDFYKITVAAMISPLMYLLIFGMGIQTTSHGEPYLHFLIPGIVSMSTMTGSFSAIAQNMSVQRLYEKALDQVMVSPTPLWQFIAGQILGGNLRGLYAGCVNIADRSELLENLSIEKIIEEDPDEIFIVMQGSDQEGAKKTLEETLTGNPAWSGLTAVREGKVHYMDKKLYHLKPNNRWGIAYDELEKLLCGG